MTTRRLRDLPWEVMASGLAYLAIGLVFGMMAARAGVGSGREAWRRSAFIASAALFAAHVGHEHYRRGRAPRSTTAHAAAAVALGAFLLAISAAIHGVGHEFQDRRLLSLVVWPLATGLPAFAAALLLALVLGRFRRRPQHA